MDGPRNWQKYELSLINETDDNIGSVLGKKRVIETIAPPPLVWVLVQKGGDNDIIVTF